MRKKKYFLFFLLISLLFYSCSEISEVEDKQIKNDDDAFAIIIIPDSLITKASNYLISKVGKQFFYSYMKLDLEKSRYSPADSLCIKHPSRCAEFLLKPHYYFVYSFKIPDKEFVDEIIEFVTDTLGNVVSSRDPFGIPQCPNNDCWDN